MIRFGSTMTISGDNVVIGASWKDGAGSKRGAAYLFARDQGGADSWGQVQKLTASTPADMSFFAYSVSLSGETLVVGAYGENNSRGAAYIFGSQLGSQPATNLCLPLMIRN